VRYRLLSLLLILWAVPSAATVSQTRADTTYLDSSQTLRVTGTVIFSPAASGGIHLGGLRDTVGAIIADSASAGGTVVDTTSTIAIPFSAGTSALPAITRLGDLNTGIYFPGADAISMTAGGAQVLRGSKGATLDSVAVIASVFSAPGTVLLGDTAADILRVKGTLRDSIRVSNGSVTSKIYIDGNEIKMGDVTGASFVGFSAVANWYQLDVQINSVPLFKMNSNGQITSDIDGTFNIGDHQLEIHSSTNCSEIDPSETSWTNCSSSRAWKTDITEVNGDSVLAALRFVMPYRYRYTGDFVERNWADPDTVADSARRVELRAKIQADSLQVRQGFMGQDVARLSRALNPFVEPDTTGYSLDPIVQGQQVAILYLMEQNDAQQEQIDNLQYIVIGLAVFQGVVLVVKKGVKGKDVLVDEKGV